ncbi:hypothetical protein [Salicibibacter kimchii]|uniref:hypothetical protein n=1 Tax=Salicibibacter kimchii TaxID=2099786 RepID=UPI00135A65A2
MRFKDMTVLITGAGSGIGEKTAVLVANEGAKVARANLANNDDDNRRPQRRCGSI